MKVGYRRLCYRAYDNPAFIWNSDFKAACWFTKEKSIEPTYPNMLPRNGNAAINPSRQYLDIHTDPPLLTMVCNGAFFLDGSCSCYIDASASPRRFSVPTIPITSCVCLSNRKVSVPQIGQKLRTSYTKLHFRFLQPVRHLKF